MIEFWAIPKPVFKEVFGEDKNLCVSLRLWMALCDHHGDACKTLGFDPCICAKVSQRGSNLGWSVEFP